MATASFTRCALLFAVLAGSIVDGGFGQSAAAGPALALEEVINDWNAGIPEELIITKIRKNGKGFRLSADEMRELTHRGVSSAVIKYLIDPTQPYSPPPPPAPPPAPVSTAPAAANPPEVRTPPRKYPPDTHAARVPGEAGLYRFVNEDALKTDVKLLMGENQGAGITKLMMKKGRAIGYLLGATAGTRISDGAPVFYLRLPEGKAIEEVILLALAQTKERREVEIGQTLDKQELKAAAMRPFESLEVGPRLFRITAAKSLVRGEYLFLLLGSAEPPKAYGKVYDFSIQPLRK
jgi:hypothetical protein